MTKLFKPFISFFRLNKRVRNLRIAYKLLPEIYTPDIKTIVKRNGRKLVFDDFKKSFTERQLRLFGKHGELLLKFIKSRNVSFTASGKENEIISIELNGKIISLFAFDYNSLKVIEEVFIDQLYDFHSKETYVVCDVGMNVAAASLYFASFENIYKVYGYEPFPDTYTIANNNIAINIGLKNKIEALNYGLGKSDQVLRVPNPGNGFLGGTTTDFVIDHLPEKLKTDTIEVNIKDVCEEIRWIKENHPQQQIVLKLDCEGAEYEIIEELDKKNLLKDISVCMIEFHLKGKKKLVDILFNNQYIIMSPVSEEVNPYGMLYAIRQ